MKIINIIIFQLLFVGVHPVNEIIIPRIVLYYLLINNTSKVQRGLHDRNNLIRSVGLAHSFPAWTLANIIEICMIQVRVSIVVYR